ncbi:MAG: ATP-binding protein [Aphanothece sp. CMT-3BRIN-NPC111]|jgi:hypothetical protein|nr:ATP-binding protein [Aphanothece sp. CMT-3BRIN-NPC111]
MTQIFGDFIDNFSSSEEYLLLRFSPTSVPLKQRWRNNGLSADFMADYLTTFFPGSEEDPSTFERQNEIKSAVSYIANELLENAMKFSDENMPQPITIQLDLQADKIIFLTTNTISSQVVADFKAYIQELSASDPSEMYIQQLEKQAEVETPIGNSGLGYVTMLNDYMAKLGWKFETVQTEPEVIIVTTMVQLML